VTSYPPGRYFSEVSDLYTGKLLMVVDVSGSMEGERMSAAIGGSGELLSQALTDSYAVGLVAFSGSASLELDLTTELRAVERALSRLRIRWSGTDMSEGIKLAHRVLRTRRGERVMAIFSDGETDRPTAIAAALAARADGIRIIAALGGDADPSFMRQVTGDDDEPLQVVPDSQVQAEIAGLAAKVPPTWSR